MGRIEILTGRERRRRWSEEDELWMLAEAEDEDIALEEVARRHDV
jgi:transposase